MRALSFRDDIPSIPNDNFKNHCLLLFDLTSMQGATAKYHYPDLVGQPLRLEPNFAFPLEHVTELIVLGERMSSIAVDKICIVRKKINWMMFASSKYSIISRYSSIGTSFHFPLTLF